MALASGNIRLKLDCLINALTSADPAVRLDAIGSLARLGRKARRSVPALVVALHDPVVPVRKMAALALGEIGSWAAVRALREVLQDKDAGFRRCAILALMNMGAEAATVAPAGTQAALPAARSPMSSDRAQHAGPLPADPVHRALAVG